MGNKWVTKVYLIASRYVQTKKFQQKMFLLVIKNIDIKHCVQVLYWKYKIALSFSWSVINVLHLLKSISHFITFFLLNCCGYQAQHQRIYHHLHRQVQSLLYKQGFIQTLLLTSVFHKQLSFMVVGHGPMCVSMFTLAAVDSSPQDLK